MDLWFGVKTTVCFFCSRFFCRTSSWPVSKRLITPPLTPPLSSLKSDGFFLPRQLLNEGRKKFCQTEHSYLWQNHATILVWTGVRPWMWKSSWRSSTLKGSTKYQWTVSFCMFGQQCLLAIPQQVTRVDIIQHVFIRHVWYVTCNQNLGVQLNSINTNVMKPFLQPQQ